MEKPASLREPMNMPDPHFPVKVNHCGANRSGQVMFSHHWHEHIEILCFVTGAATIACGSTQIDVKAGDIVVVNSNELHYGVSRSEDLFYYALICDLSLLHSRSPDASETKYIVPLTQNRLLFRNKIDGDEPLRECLLSLIRELKERGIGYELEVKSSLYRVLAMLVRRHAASGHAAEEYQQRTRNLKRFRPVFQRIEEGYREALSVEELARIAGLSRFHFSRLFKELTGRTVTEYIHAVRIDMSEQFLRDPALTVSEIAENTGFTDIYYFSRMFKKYKKVPPSEWRKTVWDSGGGSRDGERLTE